MIPQSGDIFEIAVDAGLLYVQYQMSHPVYGDIVGLNRQMYTAPVKNPADLDFGAIAIFPLVAHLEENRSRAKSAATGIRTNFEMPVFKFAVRDKNGEPIYWWLWNGDTISIADGALDISSYPERKISTLNDLTALCHADEERD